MYRVVSYVPYNYVSRPNLRCLYAHGYSNLALADPSLDTVTPIDFLFDGDIYESIRDGRKFLVDQDLHVALSSTFGCVLISPVVSNDVSSYRSFQFFFFIIFIEG